MSVTINTNTAAINAAQNLNANNTSLQKSLARLSSGSKIVNPADDAGGLAVSMRMQSAIKRTDATNNNLSNAVSYLQTQDGALQTAAKVLNRVAELKTLYSDVTKSSDDKANYNDEFKALANELQTIAKGTFNDVALFDSTDTMSVYTTESGDSSEVQTLTSSALDGKVGDLAGLTDLKDVTLDVTGTDSVTAAITEVAKMRAQNGAEQSNLGFASDLLSANKVNLEAANSRIVDVDVAQESTQMARNNILVQSSTSMLSQANQSAQVALKLLGQ